MTKNPPWIFEGVLNFDKPEAAGLHQYLRFDVDLENVGPKPIIVNGYNARLKLNNSIDVSVLPTRFINHKFVPNVKENINLRFRMERTFIEMIETKRGKEDVNLGISFQLYGARQTGRPLNPEDLNVIIVTFKHQSVSISSNKWIEWLENIGFYTRKTLEINIPSIVDEKFSEVMDYIQMARTDLIDHRIYASITNCRQAHESLKGLILNDNNMKLKPKILEFLNSKSQEDSEYPPIGKRIDNLQQKIYELGHTGPHPAHHPGYLEAELFLYTTIHTIYYFAKLIQDCPDLIR